MNHTNPLAALFARINLYKYGTNWAALAFVGFYLFDIASVASNGNHFYTAYRLFPALAAAAIAQSMWTLPDNSLWRLPHLMGCFFVSWLV
jgi:hypothetical protein